MADSLSDQLTQLQNSVKAKPADDKLRVHLFQLYAQDGKWQKALAQLQVAAQLNPGHNLLAQAYRLALRAELLREDTFKGLRSPNLLGQPPQWTSYLIEALQEDAKGHHEMSSELRSRALDAAPTASGDVDGKPFEWIADADTRIDSEDGIHVIRMPEHYGALSPLLHVVPLQLLAYHTALARGTDVDKPRNLAKSVTVE